MKTISPIFISLLVVAVVAVGQRDELWSQGKDSAIQKQQREAFRKGGLRAAAAVTGEYSGQELSEEDTVFENLEQLAAQSEAVIIGEIVDNVCWMDATGNVILTDYAVDVEHAIKGRFGKRDRLTVVIPGGRVAFDGGTSAQTRMPGVPPPITGQRYLLFLYKSYFLRPDGFRPLVGNADFTPVGRSIGMFLLSEDRGVVPRSGPKHPLRKAFHGRSEVELRGAAVAAANRSKREG